MSDQNPSDGSPKKFHWLKYKDGCGQECVECGESNAVDEFYAYCPACWRDLSPTERAILRGEEPPVEKVVHHVRMMPMPRWRMVMQWAWNLASGAAVAWLYWRLRR